MAIWRNEPKFLNDYMECVHPCAATVLVDELRPPQPAVLRATAKIGFVSPIGVSGRLDLFTVFPFGRFA
jgi:hypothetical protein